MADVNIVEKLFTEIQLFVMVSIEESKDIEKMTIDEVQSTLLVHEQKFKKPDSDKEYALKVNQEESSSYRGRGRG